MIDIINTKCFPLSIKMVESFESLDSVLHDWAKYKIQKVLCRHQTGIRSRKTSEILTAVKI